MSVEIQDPTLALIRQVKSEACNLGHDIETTYSDCRSSSLTDRGHNHHEHQQSTTPLPIAKPRKCMKFHLDIVEDSSHDQWSLIKRRPKAKPVARRKHNDLQSAIMENNMNDSEAHQMTVLRESVKTLSRSLGDTAGSDTNKFNRTKSKDKDELQKGFKEHFATDTFTVKQLKNLLCTDTYSSTHVSVGDLQKMLAVMGIDHTHDEATVNVHEVLNFAFDGLDKQGNSATYAAKSSRPNEGRNEPVKSAQMVISSRSAKSGPLYTYGSFTSVSYYTETYCSTYSASSSSSSQAGRDQPVENSTKAKICCGTTYHKTRASSISSDQDTCVLLG
eukprot:GHVH01002182.1.p1 GENE.GHVH01002182.1~~GHVH01002182.1.p1  ORF type:complete len:332 (+),score=35.83 GHVH01002182.1:54-1049(+)